jgi:hypothetical protein
MLDPHWISSLRKLPGEAPMSEHADPTTEAARDEHAAGASETNAKALPFCDRRFSGPKIKMVINQRTHLCKQQRKQNELELLSQHALGHNNVFN